MRTRFLTLVLAVSLWVVGSAVSADWVPGVIHAHSTFSDGGRTLEELVQRAKEAGAKFLIITDHYEQIDGLTGFDGDKKWGARVAESRGRPPDQGFADYRQRCAALSGPDFVVIPGAEITTLWAGAASHTLALGELAFRDEGLFSLQEKEGSQQRVVDRLNELGLIPTAAHPSLATGENLPWEWPPAITAYQYNTAVASGIRGIEFLNDHNAEQYQQTLDWYLRLLSKGQDVFVSAGCDSHYQPGDFEEEHRWQRKTWVLMDGPLSQKSLLEAIGKGHTYAANWGASFARLNPAPGFEVVRVDRPVFDLEVAFEKPTQSSKTIRIYRDGQPVHESLQVGTGARRIPYRWEDPTASIGRHWYVIEVPGVLITSPIASDVTKPPAPRAGGDIVFGSHRDGNWELYCMNVDGSNQINLTRNAADDWYGSWSPDGSKIAFYSFRDGNAEIYVMNADGSGQTRLTYDPADDMYPCWSPNGNTLVFTSWRDGNAEIYVMNTDGSGTTRLTWNGSDDWDPNWSPDGTKIVFESQRDGNMEIYAMNADGSSQTRLTRTWRAEFAPIWSPDGSKIAFHSYRDGNAEIYAMNADGTGQRNLTRNGAADCDAAWSPDGTRIAFESDRDGNFEIYVMNADGSGQTRLTRNPADDWRARWRSIRR